MKPRTFDDHWLCNLGHCFALISSTPLLLVMSESGEPVISKNKVHRKDKRMHFICGAFVVLIMFTFL